MLEMTISFVIYRLVLLSSLSCKLVSRSSIEWAQGQNDTKLGRGGTRSCVLIINIHSHFTCLGVVQISGV